MRPRFVVFWLDGTKKTGREYLMAAEARTREGLKVEKKTFDEASRKASCEVTRTMSMESVSMDSVRQQSLSGAYDYSIIFLLLFGVNLRMSNVCVL